MDIVKNLPGDIQEIVWRMYFSNTVINDLTHHDAFAQRWRCPSDATVNMCIDPGSIQVGYTNTYSTVMHVNPNVSFMHEYNNIQKSLRMLNIKKTPCNDCNILSDSSSFCLCCDVVMCGLSHWKTEPMWDAYYTIF